MFAKIHEFANVPTVGGLSLAILRKLPSVSRPVQGTFGKTFLRLDTGQIGGLRTRAPVTTLKLLPHFLSEAPTIRLAAERISISVNT
jgi:hypothetical protein